MVSTAGRFPEESVSDALERSIRNAKHLRAKDAATIAAARSLAWRIDHWDRLAEIALEQAHDDGRRPAVPQNDNTTLPTFLRYCDALGLTPKDPVVIKTGRGGKAVAPSKPEHNDFEDYMRKFG